MSHLVVTLEDKLVGEFPITKEKMTIGRKPDNDICINNLAISSYHTQIITVLDSSFLEDLNSTNGTYVNARLVKKHALEDGDLIDVGNYRIRYVGNEPKQQHEETDVLEKTIVLSPNDPEAMEAMLKKEKDSTVIQERPSSSALSNHPAPIIDTRDEDEVEVEEVQVEPAATTSQADNKPEPEVAKPVVAEQANEASPVAQNSAGPERIGKLQVLNGKNAGLVLDLKKSLTTFGSPKVAVAGVTKRSKGYFLVHVQGQEGQHTLLNGEQLKAKATQLEDNDIIEVANIKLEFFTE